MNAAIQFLVKQNSAPNALSAESVTKGEAMTASNFTKLFMETLSPEGDSLENEDLDLNKEALTSLIENVMKDVTIAFEKIENAVYFLNEEQVSILHKYIENKIPMDLKGELKSIEEHPPEKIIIDQLFLVLQSLKDNLHKLNAEVSITGKEKVSQEVKEVLSYLKDMLLHALPKEPVFDNLVKSAKTPLAALDQLAGKIIGEMKVTKETLNVMLSGKGVSSESLKVENTDKQSYSFNLLNETEKSRASVSQNVNERLPSVPVQSMDFSNTHMSRLQQFLMHGNVTSSAPPASSNETLMRQFEAILQRAQFTQQVDGTKQLTLKLHPATLGKLEITIQQLNGVMVAKMVTGNLKVKELLESQLPQLRIALQAQNLQVERVEISEQSNSVLKDKDDEDTPPNQEDELQQEETNEEEVLSFSEFFLDLLNL